MQNPVNRTPYIHHGDCSAIFTMVTVALSVYIRVVCKFYGFPRLAPHAQPRDRGRRARWVRRLDRDTASPDSTLSRSSGSVSRDRVGSCTLRAGSYLTLHLTAYSVPLAPIRAAIAQRSVWPCVREPRKTRRPLHAPTRPPPPPLRRPRRPTAARWLTPPPPPAPSLLRGRDTAPADTAGATRTHRESRRAAREGPVEEWMEW